MYIYYLLHLFCLIFKFVISNDMFPNLASIKYNFHSQSSSNLLKFNEEINDYKIEVDCYNCVRVISPEIYCKEGSLVSIIVNLTKEGRTFSVPINVYCISGRNTITILDLKVKTEANNIKLSWEVSNKNINKYIIYKMTSDSYNYDIIELSRESLLLNDLVEKQSYQICMATIDSDNETGIFNCTYLQGIFYKTGPVENIKDIVSYESITLSWNKPRYKYDNPQGYRVNITDSKTYSATILISAVLPNPDNNDVTNIYVSNEAASLQINNLRQNTEYLINIAPVNEDKLAIIISQNITTKQGYELKTELYAIPCVVLSILVFSCIIFRHRVKKYLQQGVLINWKPCNGFCEEIEKNNTEYPKCRSTNFDVDPKRNLSFSDVFDNVFNSLTKLAGEHDDLVLDSCKYRTKTGLTTKSGNASVNRKKNRFVDILPYDHCRVVLGGRKSHNDYINASFVFFVNNEASPEYIAAQGPLNDTVSDFWTMIFQQNVTCIVMLTALSMNNSSKCFKYWPNNIGDTQQFGRKPELNVTLIEENDNESHFERKFSILEKISGATRTIIQFHISSWINFSVPELDSFDKLFFRFRQIIAENHTHPYLIHCSSGVGRTGTFICIDRLINQISSGNEFINVYDTLLELNRCRDYFVQCSAQYVFIHEYIRYYLQKYCFSIQGNPQIYLNENK